VIFEARSSFFGGTVALALREQILVGEQIPMIKDHDWRMDYVIGPDGAVGGHQI